MDYGEIVKRAWDGDPTFVALCKTLWGPEASAERIIEFAKDGPDASAVHVPGNSGKHRKGCKCCSMPVLDNRGIAKAERRPGTSIPAIATHATLAAGTGIGAATLGGRIQPNLKQTGAAISALKSSPKGRRMLDAGIAARKAGKLGAISAGAAAVGAMAGHEGKKVYTGIQHRPAGQHLQRLEDRVDRVHKSAEVTGQLTDINEDKHQVFGWASIVEKDGEPVVDLQGDYIGIEELEKSAYDYVQKSRVGGAMHRRVDAEGNLIEKSTKPYHAADLIESFVVTPEKIEKMGLPSSTPVGWWVGFKVNDPEVWDSVKSGEWKGFSIHGAGRRKPIGEVSDFAIDGADFH